MKRSIFLNLIIVVLILSLAMPALAQRGDDSKRKSKNGKFTGEIEGVKILIEYGRPKVKGRAIWGKLVPYGKIWRTGADEATVISFDKDVLIQGQKLPAGSYSLFTIPGKTEWSVIFDKVAKQWGAYKYDKEKDALSVKVKPHPNKVLVEELTFKTKRNMVGMLWEKLVVPFTVTAVK